MTSSHVSLAPANLARPPIHWSVKEVKAWVEFCVTEFSLPPVCVNKFDMNGKALTLLTRQDFVERAPHAGDVLHNVFQLCLKQESPGYLRSPLLLPTPTHLTPTAAEILTRQPQVHGLRYSYIPIRPQTSSSSSCKSLYPATSSVMLSASDENIPVGPSVPASMLSPAPSEKCPSDTDSSPNENGQSPHSSDHETEFVEGVTYDPGRNLTYDMSDQNDDGVCRLLWEFLYQLLQDPKWSQLVSWESKDELTFRIMNPNNLADAWGKQKNRSNMTYEKLSRALRYYYKMNIIKKVPGKKLTYKFLQHPATIRRGQRGARPHSSRNVKVRSTEADQPANETTAPDSSTFPPSRTMSISSTTSSTATMHSHDPNRDEQSTRHHLDELAENTTKSSFLSEIHDQPVFGSPKRLQGNSQELGSFLYRDETNVTTSETAKNVRSLRDVSPGAHLELRGNHETNVYDTQRHYESDDNEALSRSHMTAFSNSPKNNSSKVLVVNDNELKAGYNLKISTTDNYREKNHIPLHIPEQNSHLFSYRDHISNHISAQGRAHVKDVFSNPPSCSSQSDTTPAYRNRSPLMFKETSIHSNDRYSPFYTKTSHRHHPYPSPHSEIFNPSSPLLSYDYANQSSNFAVSDEYQRGLKNYVINQGSLHEYPYNFSQNIADSYCNQYPLKQEVCDRLQDEPEDLSLKPSIKKDNSRKDNSRKDISKPEFTASENAIKDAHKCSPRSCSSDSAYNSDRADFTKEETFE